MYTNIPQWTRVDGFSDTGYVYKSGLVKKTKAFFKKRFRFLVFLGF